MVLVHKVKEWFNPSTILDHPLFLRWFYINAVGVTFFVILGFSGFFNGVHGPPLIAAIVSLILTFAVSAFMGKLYWRADKATEVLKEKIIHASERAFYCVAILQTIGMLGAMFGYREITHATDITDASKAVHVATLGLGNGLTATIVGVLASVLIGLLHFELEHKLTKP